MAINNNILAYYKFDEASTNGTVAEIIDSSYDGNFSGEALQSVDLIEAGGLFNNMLDGSNGTAKLLVPNETSISMSFWTTPQGNDLDGNYHNLIQKPNDFYLEWKGTQVLLFRNYSGASVSIDTPLFQIGTRVLVCISVSSAGTVIKVNDTLISSNSDEVYPTNSDYVNLFGWDGSSSSERTDGNLDELVFYRGGLSDQDMTDLYNAGAGVELIPTQVTAEEWVWDGTNRVLSISSGGYIGLAEIQAYNDTNTLDFISNIVADQYEISAKFILKNTTLVETKKSITIKSGTEDWIELQEYGNAKFGEVISEANQTSDKGCYFYFDEDSAGAKLVYSSSSKTSLEMYSCHIYKIGGQYGNIRMYNGLFKSKNTIMRNIELWDNYNCDVYNFQSENSQFVLSNCIGLFNKIEIRSAETNMYSQSNGNYTLKNINVIDGRDVLKMQSSYSGDFRLINTESNTWNINFYSEVGGKLHREYEYGVRVADDTDTGITGVSCLLQTVQKQTSKEVDYMESTEIEHRYITDSSGNIDTSTVELGYYDNTGADPQVIKPYYPHTQRVRKYGYNFLSVLKTVEHKSSDSLLLFNDSTIAQDYATATGHSGIVITEEATPVTENGKDYSITLDCGNNNLEDTWHYLQAKLSTHDTVNGRDGLVWHNMLKRSGTAFYTDGGGYDDSGTYKFKGVRIINKGAGTLISTQSDDKSVYIVPVSYTLSFTGLQVGSDVVLLEAGTNNVIDSIDQTSGTVWNYTYSTAIDFDYGVIKAGYVTIYRYGLTMAEADSTVPVSQLIDRSYV